MKNCILLLLLGMTTSAFSQQVSGPELTSITETSAWTIIRLESEQPFIVGANRYVLHVGDQVFEHSRHPEGNESILEFLVDPDEWKAIDKAAEAVLVYGLYEGNMSETGRQQHMEGLFTPIGPLTQ